MSQRAFPIEIIRCVTICRPEKTDPKWLDPSSAMYRVSEDRNALVSPG